MTDTVPLTTQEEYQNITQGSQKRNFVLVRHDKMTELHLALVKECQNYLQKTYNIIWANSNELTTQPNNLRLFLIPNMDKGLIERIKKHFEKSIIVLPRAVLELRDLGEDLISKIHVRNLTISLTMYKCTVFLVESCNIQSIRKMIFQMGGTLVRGFNDEKERPNVVITDRADNKYCAKAFKEKIPVVPAAWVDENYQIALSEEKKYFKHNALDNIDKYIIKPFFGLKFRIDFRRFEAHVKHLILDNQGFIIFGNNNDITHIVLAPGQDATVNHKKCVDIDFLKLCARCGYYLTNKDYQELVNEPEVLIVKEEAVSPPIEVDCVEENSSPRLDTIYNSDDYTSVENVGSRSEISKTEASGAINQRLPPPPTPQQSARPLRQQQQLNNSLNDMILKVMATLDTVQTQQASTQMRRLPDQELQIEQTIEPSQALWWSDKRD